MTKFDACDEFILNKQDQKKKNGKNGKWKVEK
jgi:hypothetical protein